MTPKLSWFVIDFFFSFFFSQCFPFCVLFFFFGASRPFFFFCPDPFPLHSFLCSFFFFFFFLTKSAFDEEDKRKKKKKKLKDRQTRKIEPVALIPNDTNPVNL